MVELALPPKARRFAADGAAPVAHIIGYGARALQVFAGKGNKDRVTVLPERLVQPSGTSHAPCMNSGGGPRENIPGVC